MEVLTENLREAGTFQIVVAEPGCSFGAGNDATD